MSWVTVYGVAAARHPPAPGAEHPALTYMMVMYWLEHRGPVFTLGFGLGCLWSSIYGFLAGAWPFGVLEAIWCLIAVPTVCDPTGCRGEVPA
jgi:hypothetical protein